MKLTVMDDLFSILRGNCRCSIVRCSKTLHIVKKRMFYKNSEHLYKSLITLHSFCNSVIFLDALELVELLISVAAFLTADHIICLKVFLCLFICLSRRSFQTLDLC